jgi:hypothetical protein
MNVGAEMGISESDVIEAILGATGLPRETIGKVDVRERHAFINVASERAQGIVAKLNRPKSRPESQSETGVMKALESAKPVSGSSRLPCVLRILIVGRDALLRSKSRLHFVLITHDLSENSRKEVIADLVHYPIVQRYTAAELEQFFGLKGTKVLGFAKSGLAQSIYAEMKEHRINKPVQP